MQWCNSLLVTFQCQTVGLGRWNSNTLKGVVSTCQLLQIHRLWIHSKKSWRSTVRKFQKKSTSMRKKTKLPVFQYRALENISYIWELGRSHTIRDGNIVFPYCMFVVYTHIMRWLHPSQHTLNKSCICEMPHEISIHSKLLTPSENNDQIPVNFATGSREPRSVWR